MAAARKKYSPCTATHCVNNRQQACNPLYVPSNSDASHKHQGRKRQFPHVEGNFATHVYITAHSPESVKRALLAELDRQKEAIPKLEVLGRSVKPDDQGIAKPFHLSLSRTVPIKFHQIDPLIASLQAALKQQHSFQLEFCGWRVFMNDEQTRTFLAIPAGLGATELHFQSPYTAAKPQLDVAT
ncbi:MAG: U6 snRNA phosphodiesterase-like [Trebouxia sp. A1-2]|nr:MAG: U6 snRNA phosphodiesterase-like [Trebouxia sp. A1-2]